MARSRAFDTPIGRFIFQRVPARNPRAGVQAVKLGHNAWVKDGLGFLTDSLRMQEEDLSRIELSSCEEIQESLRSRRVREYLEGLQKELAG